MQPSGVGMQKWRRNCVALHVAFVIDVYAPGASLLNRFTQRRPVTVPVA